MKSSASLMHKVHDVIAIIITISWVVPVFAYIFSYIAGKTFLNADYESNNAEEIIFWILCICGVGILYALTIFSQSKSINQYEKKVKKFAFDYEPSSLLLILLPAHLIWMAAFTITYVVLYIPLTPFYIIANIGGK